MDASRGGLLGLVANPASGKDLRRLVARASVFDNQEKQAIVRRVLAGAAASGVKRVAYLDDAHGINRGALAEYPELETTALEVDITGTALDTISAARALQDLAADVCVILGGDGTSRAFTLGWPQATILPLSTGTNNVFPVLMEATVAGSAAGLLASGRVKPASATHSSKLIRLQIDGEHDDLALIDAVLTSDRFVGTRALLHADRLREIILTRADPSAVGMTAIGGLLQPVDSIVPHGLRIWLGEDGELLRAPIAPGLFQELKVIKHAHCALQEKIQWYGPGVIALDGERERYLAPEQGATLCLEHNGPKVIDVGAVMHQAARNHCYGGVHESQQIKSIGK